MTYENLLELQERTLVESMPDDLEKLITSYTPSNHYRFLHLFMKKYQPKTVVELGTHYGLSSLAMARGNPNNTIHTVDIIPWEVDINNEPNIKEYIGSSIDEKIYNNLPNEIDVLFSDTNHDYFLTSTEYKVYLPKMKKGGVIFFDDVLLDLGVDKFWNELEHEKMLLEKIHLKYGFGSLIV